MRANEFAQPVNSIALSESELTFVTEGISDEIKALTTTNVTQPFTTFKRNNINLFAKKLQAWALSALHEFEKAAGYNTEKHYIQTLQKIINNPIKISGQIFDTTVSRLAEPSNSNLGLSGSTTIPKARSVPADTVSKVEQQKIDDLLADISL
jgi:hypothetical protein